MSHSSLHPLFEEFDLIEYRKLPSTQDKIKEKIKEKDSLYIIRADIQTEGRGRYGKKWESPEGGLWFSFNRKKEVDEEKYIVKLSLCLIKTLQKFRNGFKIKYPNDIMYNNKKIAGILIELWRNYYITGIGININNKEYPENGISLIDIIKKSTNLNEFIKSFFYNLEKTTIDFSTYKKLLI